MAAPTSLDSLVALWRFVLTTTWTGAVPPRAATPLTATASFFFLLLLLLLLSPSPPSSSPPHRSKSVRARPATRLAPRRRSSRSRPSWAMATAPSPPRARRMRSTCLRSFSDSAFLSRLCFSPPSRCLFGTCARADGSPSVSTTNRSASAREATDVAAARSACASCRRAAASSARFRARWFTPFLLLPMATVTCCGTSYYVFFFGWWRQFANCGGKMRNVNGWLTVRR